MGSTFKATATLAENPVRGLLAKVVVREGAVGGTACHDNPLSEVVTVMDIDVFGIRMLPPSSAFPVTAPLAEPDAFRLIVGVTQMGNPARGAQI